MSEYTLQGLQEIHTEVVVQKQKNKTPHQNTTHNPPNTYTIKHQKQKEIHKYQTM